MFFLERFYLSVFLNIVSFESFWYEETLWFNKTKLNVPHIHHRRVKTPETYSGDTAKQIPIIEKKFVKSVYYYIPPMIYDHCRRKNP